MKNASKQILTVLFFGGVLASCTTTEGRSELGPDLEYSGSDCISTRTIRDYVPLDSRNLLVEAGGRRKYLVSLVMTSFDLKSSFRIGFQSRDDWLCPYGGDRIVFEGFGDGAIGIRSISRLTDEQADDLLIRYGKKSPPEQEDPAPDELKGAEVEELG